MYSTGRLLPVASLSWRRSSEWAFERKVLGSAASIRAPEARQASRHLRKAPGCRSSRSQRPPFWRASDRWRARGTSLPTPASRCRVCHAETRRFDATSVRPSVSWIVTSWHMRCSSTRPAQPPGLLQSEPVSEVLAPARRGDARPYASHGRTTGLLSSTRGRSRMVQRPRPDLRRRSAAMRIPTENGGRGSATTPPTRPPVTGVVGWQRQRHAGMRRRCNESADDTLTTYCMKTKNGRNYSQLRMLWKCGPG